MDGVNPFKELVSMQQRHIRAKALDGDYYNEDNILMCGKCDTPKEFMTPGLWYYRVKSQDGRYLPTVPIRLRESAHRFMTEPVTL